MRKIIISGTILVFFMLMIPNISAIEYNTIQEKEHIKYMATGFKDTTRIASSSPDIWSDIFMGNRENVLSSIQRFKELLNGIEEDVKENRKEDLKKKLETLL